mmetsp:Transcript_2644/g.4561  ORF Transcript_2644/g.4561 Transcript_2644/m.4561 type:complete len:239 (+) Transcript_2644:1235-1951(+)
MLRRRATPKSLCRATRKSSITTSRQPTIPPSLMAKASPMIRWKATRSHQMTITQRTSTRTTMTATNTMRTLPMLNLLLRTTQTPLYLLIQKRLGCATSTRRPPTACATHRPAATRSRSFSIRTSDLTTALRRCAPIVSSSSLEANGNTSFAPSSTSSRKVPTVIRTLTSASGRASPTPDILRCVLLMGLRVGMGRCDRRLFRCIVPQRTSSSLSRSLRSANTRCRLAPRLHAPKRETA